MAETLSVDELFASEPFGILLTEWERASLKAQDVDRILIDALAAHSGNDDEDSDARFAGLLDPFSPDAIREIYWDAEIDNLVGRKLSTDEKDRLARQEAIDFGTSSGISPFAAYGLRRFMVGWSENTTRTGIRETIKESEKQLQKFGELVVSHSGDILTVVLDNGSAYSARVGSGEVSLTDEDRLVIPTQGNSYYGYLSVLGLKGVIIKKPEGLSIGPSEIVGNPGGKWPPAEYVPPSTLLTARRILEEGTLVTFGDPPLGPVLIPETILSDKDAEYYRTLVENVKATMLAAQLQLEYPTRQEARENEMFQAAIDSISFA